MDCNESDDIICKLKMERIKEKLQRLSEEYKYSNRIYNKYYNYVNIPSIILTSSASIFSYLNTSEMMPSDYRNYITLITALLTSFSTMLQTISSSCEFNVKRTKFREAANQCDHLIDKVFFEMR